MAADKGLGKVPDFTRHRKLSRDRVGNGQRLAKLRSANRFLDQFSEKCVCVIVESFHFSAGKQQERVRGTAEIQIWRTAAIDSMEVARRDRGLRSFAWYEHSLRAKKYIGHFVCGVSVNGGACDRYAGSQQFQTGRHGKFEDFVQTVARRKFGRVIRSEHPGFKLEVTHWRQRCWSRNGWASGIRYRPV